MAPFFLWDKHCSMQPGEAKQKARHHFVGHKLASAASWNGTWATSCWFFDMSIPLELPCFVPHCICHLLTHYM